MIRQKYEKFRGGGDQETANWIRRDMRLWPNARCMYIIGVRPTLVSATTTKSPTTPNTPLDPGPRIQDAAPRSTTGTTWVWLIMSIRRIPGYFTWSVHWFSDCWPSTRTFGPQDNSGGQDDKSQNLNNTHPGPSQARVGARVSPTFDDDLSEGVAPKEGFPPTAPGKRTNLN